ncbi:unnamed protein product [Bathycoccus prasinos]
MRKYHTELKVRRVGHMYIGMQKQNKYVKSCVVRKRDAAKTPKHLIIDPVDRVKRFVVILESVLRQLSTVNNHTWVPLIEKAVLALDIHDIPASGQVSRGTTKLVGAPFRTKPKHGRDTSSITIPFTKLNYALSRKNGEAVVFYDETFESLKYMKFRNLSERRDQMLFTGQVKETEVGYRHGRKVFDELAKINSRIPPDFVSNSRAPYYSFPEQAKYKFILSLSGAGAWTFYRSYGFLLGSLMFCQDAPQELWYYDQFKPMVHYVPVQEDLSDVKQKLQWARENPTKAAAIAAEGRFLALKIFDPKVIMYEFKKRIIEALLGKEDEYDSKSGICNLSIIQFCRGPKVGILNGILNGIFDICARNI